MHFHLGLRAIGVRRSIFLRSWIISGNTYERMANHYYTMKSKRRPKRNDNNVTSRCCSFLTLSGCYCCWVFAIPTTLVVHVFSPCAVYINSNKLPCADPMILAIECSSLHECEVMCREYCAIAPHSTSAVNFEYIFIHEATKYGMDGNSSSTDWLKITFQASNQQKLRIDCRRARKKIIFESRLFAKHLPRTQNN